MGFPKLKHPNLCRLTMYLVTAGPVFLVLFGMIFLMDRLALPDLPEILLFFGAVSISAIPLIRNFLVLLFMEMTFGEAHCHFLARTQYPLPAGTSPETIRAAVGRFGISCEPRSPVGAPVALRYAFSKPWTIHNCGIEKVVALYQPELLDSDSLCAIVRSAKTNSTALQGKKTAPRLDKHQKKAPLHRVTVAVILAERVSESLWPGLYNRLAGLCGDPEKDCLLVCVADWSRKCCVFPSQAVPYHGFELAVKNKGIRLIRRLVLGGKALPREDGHRLPPLKDYNPELSLWRFWKLLRRQLHGPDRQAAAIFKTMDSGQIREKGRELYIRRDSKGLCLWVSRDKGSRTVTVEPPDSWYWPRMSRIPQKVRNQLRQVIVQYYENQGWHPVFRAPEPEELLDESEETA